AFGGALLYRLQQKEAASTCTQLLVIWGCRSDKTYLYALLIEHESELTWNKDMLKRLYDAHNNLCHKYFTSREWLLNDDTKLKLEYKSLYGGFEMDVIISEKRSLSDLIKPLW